jgi:hypothetical protein
VEGEDLVVRGLDAVVGEDWSQAGGDPALPVDQGAVAVEADDLVPVSLEQSVSPPFLYLSAAS